MSFRLVLFSISVLALSFFLFSPLSQRALSILKIRPVQLLTIDQSPLMFFHLVQPDVQIQPQLGRVRYEREEACTSVVRSDPLSVSRGRRHRTIALYVIIVVIAVFFGGLEERQRGGLCAFLSRRIFSKKGCLQPEEVRSSTPSHQLTSESPTSLFTSYSPPPFPSPFSFQIFPSQTNATSRPYRTIGPSHSGRCSKYAKSNRSIATGFSSSSKTTGKRSTFRA